MTKQIKVISNYKLKYANPGDVGVDLRSQKDIIIGNYPSVIPTGVKIELPEDIVAIVHPRSSLSSFGVICLTGIIDCGYRGEIKVLLADLFPGSEYFIEKDTRIAQLIFQPIIRPDFIYVDELSTSVRGVNGFGSTGKNLYELKGD